MLFHPTDVWEVVRIENSAAMREPGLTHRLLLEYGPPNDRARIYMNFALWHGATPWAVGDFLTTVASMLASGARDWRKQMQMAPP